ncbi:MAG TPA: hypothetical protein VGZ22_00590 [Isosphaeraceae bacterium]|nr:hypothetical protein [Isosphaeraceae bacterium]
MRVAVGVGGVLVGVLAVLVGRCGVLLGLCVLPGFVVVRRLMMVMGGGVVVSRGLMVVLGGRVLLVCHVRVLPGVVKRRASAVNAPAGSLDAPS